MRGPIVVIFVVSALSHVSAQVADRSLERIAIALEQPRSAVIGMDAERLRTTERQIHGAPIFEPLVGAPQLGPFEFVAPQLRGEFVRVALPVGEYVSHGLRALAEANRRRQEQSARARVEADLKAWSRAAKQR